MVGPIQLRSGATAFFADPDRQQWEALFCGQESAHFGESGRSLVQHPHNVRELSLARIYGRNASAWRGKWANTGRTRRQYSARYCPTADWTISSGEPRCREWRV